MNKFLRNAWYVAAWADELDAESHLSRTILEIPIVLFRHSKGIAALADRCSHRFAPLHLGRRVGDNAIECPYHGLQFDATGACTLNPHGDGSIPTRASIQSFQTIEKYGLIWIWMGEKEKYDETKIPDFSFHTDPSYHTVKGYTLAKSNYELLTDNLMDLGHIEFLHGGLLGSDAVRRAKTEVYQEETTVHSNRRTFDERLPPFVHEWYHTQGELASRWLNMRWDPPANLLLLVGVLSNGLPQEEAHESPGAHLLTPETETSTHYFWSQARNWGGINPKMDEGRLNALKKAFDEQDKPMVEAVQRNMGTTDLNSLSPVLLATDAGAVRARRVLSSLKSAEIKTQQ